MNSVHMLYCNNKGSKTWQQGEQTVATTTPHPDTTTTTTTTTITNTIVVIAHLKWIEYVVWN